MKDEKLLDRDDIRSSLMSKAVEAIQTKKQDVKPLQKDNNRNENGQ